ncbi:MAG: hypothetical protein QM756_09615 [Polyangiaceae bacterium]
MGSKQRADIGVGGWGAVALSCWAIACSGSGGQTGDEGPVLRPLCTVTSYEELGVDDVSAIGFSASQAFEKAFGEHSAPYTWREAFPSNPPPFQLPETDSAITLAVTATEDVVRLEHRVNESGQVDSACHDVVSTRVLVDLRTAAGEFDEHVSGVLSADSWDHSSLVAKIDFGQLTGTLSQQRLARAFGVVTLGADFSPYCSSGGLLGNYQINAKPFVTLFGDFSAADCGAVPDATARKVQAAMSFERRGHLTAYPRNDFISGASVPDPIPLGESTLWIEPSQEPPQYAIASLHSPARFSAPATLHLSTADGVTHLALPVVAVLPLETGGGGFAPPSLESYGHCSWGQEPSKQLAECGDLGVDLSGYVSVGYAVELEVSPDGNVAARLRVLGGVRPRDVNGETSWYFTTKP